MRSNIQLDQELLKEYRLGAGLTQQKLAEKAFVASQGYSDKSQLRTYQKIEKTGVTSPKGAGLIAKALGISVSDLQQPNFTDRKATLKELIQRAFESMKEAKNADGLARLAEAFNLEQSEMDDLVEDCKKYDEIVRSAIRKIEWHHLLCEEAELEDFARVFGATAKEIRPAAFNSFWLVSYVNQLSYSLGTVVSGYEGVVNIIKNEWEKIPKVIRDAPESIKANLSNQGKIYRLNLEAEHSRYKFSFSFYACDATHEHGLKAINTSKFENEKLIADIKNFLFDCVGTVVINGEIFPAEDKTYVYQIQSFNIDFDNEKKEIGTRIIHDNFLFRGALQSFLKAQDMASVRFTDPIFIAPCWLFPGVEILLLEGARASKSYSITWGWLECDGAFHEEHWPIILRRQFISAAISSRDFPIFIVEENDVIPSFEPEPISPEGDGASK